MIKSRFRLFVYVYFLIIILFLVGSIYFFSHPGMNLKGKAGGSFPAPVVGFLLLLCDILLFIVIAKKTFFIRITSDCILIKGFLKNITIRSIDIRSIDLLSMQNLYLSIGLTTISTFIECENGTCITIADPFYKNISELKKALVANFSEKIKPFGRVATISSSSDSPFEFQKFSGNRYFNLNSSIFFITTIFFSIMAFQKKSSLTAFIFIIPITAFYLGLGYQLHYFLVSNRQIIVKNLFLPWINKCYDIADIIAINFESPHKRSEALRITTVDFKSKAYSAGSLRQKDWRELRRQLSRLKINLVT